jgi:hypothetical protein
MYSGEGEIREAKAGETLSFSGLIEDGTPQRGGREYWLLFLSYWK